MQPQLAPAPHIKGFPAQQELTQEQNLREHLLHHVNESNHAATAGNQHAIGVGVHAPQATSPTTPAHNIDPAIAGSAIMSHSPGESGGDDNGVADSKKGGKRELSTSKRAAQNRAAQRAFRQRKEGHIKKLEEQVKDIERITSALQRCQEENYQLREYIISLQSRLIESDREFPPAPVNVHLSHSVNSGPSVSSSATAAAGGTTNATAVAMTTSPTMSHLQQSAAQAVDLGKASRPDPKTEPAFLSKKA